MLYSLPVLMYHSISRFKHYLCVSPEQFDEHCRVISEAGWQGISLEEAEEYFLKKKKLPAKVCLFTFDDGYLDNYVHAEPILRRYGHRGVIFPVLGLVEPKNILRPAADISKKSGELTKLVKSLDKRPTALRNGRPVIQLSFCSWQELKHMHFEGNMSAAPHSMHHHRVVRSLKIKGIFQPQGRGGFFSIPPHEICYGYPRFELGHGLAQRGYRILPEVLALVKSLVPQEKEAAIKFLAEPEHQQAVINAVLKLPRLGVRESKLEYESRVFRELDQCRELFIRHLGINPISFCWPWGDFSKTALELAREAGFRVFFSTGRRANRFGRATAVHRISIRHETGEQVLQKLRFSSNAVFEDVYGLFPF